METMRIRFLTGSVWKIRFGDVCVKRKIVCVNFFLLINHILLIAVGQYTMSSAVSMRTAVLPEAMQASGFPSNFAVTEGMDDAGEPQALSVLDRALEGPPGVSVLVEEHVDIDLQGTEEPAGRVLSSVSEKLPNVLSDSIMWDRRPLFWTGPLWLQLVVIRQVVLTLQLLWGLVCRLNLCQFFQSVCSFSKKTFFICKLLRVLVSDVFLLNFAD